MQNQLWVRCHLCPIHPEHLKQFRFLKKNGQVGDLSDLITYKSLSFQEEYTRLRCFKYSEGVFEALQKLVKKGFAVGG